MHPIADADERETAPVLLMSHIRPHHRTDAGGIRVGNVAEVDNQETGIVSAHFGLEIEQSRDDQRPAKAEDSLSSFRPGNIFDDKGIRRHYEILVERRSLEKYEFCGEQVAVQREPPGVTFGVKADFCSTAGDVLS